MPETRSRERRRRRPRRHPPARTSEPARENAAALEGAVEALARFARQRLISRRPGPGGGDRSAELELSLTLPLSADPQRIAAAARDLEQELARRIDALVASLSAVRPGRVPCLRCRSSECEHAAPARAVEVFAGYGPTGAPRFVELAQLVLERKPEAAEVLYGPGAQLATVVMGEEDLHQSLLPVFAEEPLARLHAQVAAGYWQLARLDERARQKAASARRASLGRAGEGEAIAVTFQILSTRSPAGRPRLELNPVVALPDAEPFETVVDRFGEAPWRGPLEWATRALQDIERGLRSGGAANGVDWERRVLGVAEGLERRLRRLQRNRQRRTRHAEERQRQRRPVAKALDDLEVAAERSGVLWDRAKKTLIVLGARGRVHVFSPSGKLVTSVHYPQEVIARRRRSGRWAAAEQSVVEALRSSIERAPGP